MEDCAIRTEGLRKSFGKHEVLRGLDLKVPAGSLYAFLGRNGEGKSTTMQVLLNILGRDGGSVRVLGTDPALDELALKRRVAWIPETPNCYDWMKVEELLDFFGGFFPREWDAAKARESARSAGLPLDRRFGLLSLGMKAKVLLVAALARDPELLLLDDPTSGLDAVVRREFTETLLDLAHGRNKTIFFSSHLITEMERVADYVGILRNGTMLYEGSLDDLKAGHRRIRLILREGAAGELGAIPQKCILRKDATPREIDLVVKDYDESWLATLPKEQYADIEALPLDLEDLFVMRTKDA